MNLYFQKLTRNIRSHIQYPYWVMFGRGKADNHVYKMKRIERLAQQFMCTSFIETGTFYGQTTSFASKIFENVISIEISKKFHELNSKFFEKTKNVCILLGDSSERLLDAIEQSSGNVLFWLDGHFSGGDTGKGKVISPVIAELDIIRRCNLENGVIVIDDLRLFTGKFGYPTILETIQKLHAIDSTGLLSVDSDALVFSFNKRRNSN